MPLMLFIFIFLFLQDLTSESPSLFISSDPIKAAIRINGRELKETTPALIRNLPEGSYVVEVESPGYAVERKVIEIRQGALESLHYSMEPAFLTAMIPDEASEGKSIQIHPGYYTIEETDEGIDIKPRYPYQDLINGLNIAVPLISGFSVAMTINEVQNPRDNENFISPFLLATYIANTILIGADIGLHIHKGKYLDNMSLTLENSRTAKEEVERIYNKGESKLEIGDFQSALEQYEEIITSHSDSIFYPLAIYKRGTIAMILLDLEGAESDFDRIVHNLPMPEIYNKSLRKLMEISLRRKNFNRVIAHIDRLIPSLDYTEKEEIDEKRCDILDIWAENDPSIRSRAIEWRRKLIKDYGHSINAPYYRYDLAVLLIQENLQEEALEHLEAIESGQEDLELFRKVIELKEELKK